MSYDDTVIMQVACHNDDDYGMTSVYRFWSDGSFKKILDACQHTKAYPTREQIAEQFTAAEAL